MGRKYFIVGGAGFVGSHLCKKILSEEKDIRMTIYDNFSSGKIWHLDEISENKNLEIIEADVKNIELLTESIKDSDIVYHFASNPDIAKAMIQPDIDFWEGTYLTNNVLEAMRRSGVRNLLYASGSGVYGDANYAETGEDFSPQLPISTYGASKLSCEAMISSYCFMFDMNAAAFRFANVVGPNQTHGVGYDFVKKLLQDNSKLDILGDGNQSKSYIYVDDVLNAIRMIEEKYLKDYSYYNISTKNYITVKEIAGITADVLKLSNVEYKFSGGDRGWKGDVPVVRLNSDKIRSKGWTNRYSSSESMRLSVQSMYEDALKNKFEWKGVDS